LDYLLILHYLPYLASSPDGLIGDNSIIEIKICPFSIRDFTPKNAYKENKIKYLKQKGNKLVLKKSHDYYFQVQGQLHITQRKFCYFVVRTPKGKHTLSYFN